MKSVDMDTIGVNQQLLQAAWTWQKCGLLRLLLQTILNKSPSDQLFKPGCCKTKLSGPDLEGGSSPSCQYAHERYVTIKLEVQEGVFEVD